MIPGIEKCLDEEGTPVGFRRCLAEETKAGKAYYGLLDEERASINSYIREGKTEDEVEKRMSEVIVYLKTTGRRGVI